MWAALACRESDCLKRWSLITRVPIKLQIGAKDNKWVEQYFYSLYDDISCDKELAYTVTIDTC